MNMSSVKKSNSLTVEEVHKKNNNVTQRGSEQGQYLCHI